MLKYIETQCFDVNNDKANLLQYLCFRGKHFQVIDTLLKKNKKLDKDDGTLKNEDSALHLACLGLQKKSMEKLLLSRVNVNG